MFALSILADVTAGSSHYYGCDKDNEQREVFGNTAAGRRQLHDIMVEQGNKDFLPAIVLPFCSGLGSVPL